MYIKGTKDLIIDISFFLCVLLLAALFLRTTLRLQRIKTTQYVCSEMLLLLDQAKKSFNSTVKNTYFYILVFDMFRNATTGKSHYNAYPQQGCLILF